MRKSHQLNNWEDNSDRTTGAGGFFLCSLRGVGPLRAGDRQSRQKNPPAPGYWAVTWGGQSQIWPKITRERLPGSFVGSRLKNRFHQWFTAGW